MAGQEPPFTIGIEEEYLLDDLQACARAEATEALMAEGTASLAGQVSPEVLQRLIEAGAQVCETIGEAREDPARLRRALADVAAGHRLASVAAYPALPSRNPIRWSMKARTLAGM